MPFYVAINFSVFSMKLNNLIKYLLKQSIAEHIPSVNNWWHNKSNISKINSKC